MAYKGKAWSSSFWAKKYRRFRWKLDFFVRCTNARIDVEKDNVIVVTGDTGSGKSTWVGKLCFEKYAEIDNKFEDGKMFDPYEDIVYNRNTLIDKMKNNMGRAIWVDEGIISANRKNTMSRANKLLGETKNINRKKLNTLFFCIPYIEEFDISILKHATMWVYVDRRGFANVYFPERKSMWGKARWDLEKMKKIYDEFQKYDNKQNYTPPYIYDNFRGYMSFGKMLKKHEEIYEKINTEKANANHDSHDDTNPSTPESRERVAKETAQEDKEKIYNEVIDKIISGELKSKNEIFPYIQLAGSGKESFVRRLNDRMIKRGVFRTVNQYFNDKKTESVDVSKIASAFD